MFPHNEGTPTSNRRRRWKWIIIGLPVVALLVCVVFVILKHRIVVTVHNEGPTELRSVVVHVTGRSYYLGDLAVGESKSVTVRPKGESHVELEFLDALGRNQRLLAGGYFEPGYKGTYTVFMKNEHVHQVDDRISLTLTY